MWEKGRFSTDVSFQKKNQQKDHGNKQSLVEDEDADVDPVSVEENAELMRIVSFVSKNVHGNQPWKVPYMIHNNGTGIECQSSRTKC